MVLLVIDIVLLNFVVYNSKIIFVHGITWDTNAPLIVYLIFAILVMIATFFMMYFIIYLEDYLHDRNKRKIRLYEVFIEKVILKGGRD
jgi:uncharacterized integral membrane protein